MVLEGEKVELDLFGIKIGSGSKSGRPTAIQVEYKITKEELLEKFGFYKEEVTFIAYDYKTGILTIKARK